MVFLTGDFTTIESYFEPEKLAYGFAPLKELPGKLFACLGVCILLPFDLFLVVHSSYPLSQNHDYESLETVEEALRDTGVVLLKDENVLVETPVGTIEILGTEYPTSFSLSLSFLFLPVSFFSSSFPLDTFRFLLYIYFFLPL